MAHDRGCEITEIQPHTVTIERKERNSILLVQHWVKLMYLFDQFWNLDPTLVSTKLRVTIAVLSNAIYTNVACTEIDDFYLQVQETLETLSAAGNPNSVSALQVQYRHIH
jgi:hypothetical protein